MAKTTRMYMTRRGTRYLIERSADGTFGKFVPVGKAGAKKVSGKKASGKKASAKISSKAKARKPAAASKRART